MSKVKRWMSVRFPHNADHFTGRSRNLTWGKDYFFRNKDLRRHWKTVVRDHFVATLMKERVER